MHMRTAHSIVIEEQDVDFLIIERLLRRVKRKHTLHLFHGKQELSRNDGFRARLIDNERGIVEFERMGNTIHLTIDRSAKIKAVRYPTNDTLLTIPFDMGINVKLTLEGNPYIVVH